MALLDCLPNKGLAGFLAPESLGDGFEDMNGSEAADVCNLQSTKPTPLNST
jgi:hypothetical protein